MRHRALDYPPDTPVAELGLAALDEIIARGDLDDWGPVLRELRRDPRGVVATRIEQLLDRRPDDGSTAVWQAFLHDARHDARSSPIGPALRTLREGRGLTQAEVARRLGATQPEVSKLERRVDARLSTVNAYVSALGGTMRLVAAFEDGETDLASGRHG